MRLKYWFLILLFFIALFPRKSTPSLIKVTTLDCVSLDMSFCVIPTCRMKAVGRDIAEVFVEVKLLQLPIDNVTVEAGVKRRNHKDETPLMRLKIDGCSFWRNKRRNPVAELLFNIIGFQKYSNINHSCPYNHDLIVNGARLNQNYLKMLPLPFGEFFGYMTWYAYNVPRATLTTAFKYFDQQ